MSTGIFIVFLLISSSSGFKLEQSCSKFHYEEQTLEKLIRLQLFVEKTKEELDITQNKVIEALSELSKERKEFKADTEAARDEMNQLKTSVGDEMATLKKQYKDAIDNYAGIKAELRESLITPIVAFKSNKVVDKSMTENKVVVFSTNLLNTDGSYDNKTGFFTAPLGGVYLFTAQICLFVKVRSYYAIYVGETIMTSSLLGDADYEACYTLDTIAKVEKEEKVSIRCWRSCGGDSVWENSYSTNSFSGLFIRGNK